MSSSRAKQQQQHSAPPAPQQQQQQQARQQPGYVPCPICGMSVRQSFIHSHVDTCLEKAGGVAAVAPPPSSGRKPRQPQQQQQQQQPPTSAQPPVSSGSGGFGSLHRVRRGSPLEAPPKLCFELMKERDLKAKLTQLGLSNDGNKKVCAIRKAMWAGGMPGLEALHAAATPYPNLHQMQTKPYILDAGAAHSLDVTAAASIDRWGGAFSHCLVAALSL